jgi:hypothetical protein
MSWSCIARICYVIAWCKTQEGRTYHSPLESVRAEPALLPAAAEAKEAGAIVVVECCGRYDGVSRPFVLWWWRAAN